MEDAVGHKLDDLISLDRSEIDRALSLVRARGEWSGELQVVDVTGATRVMESRWTLLRNENGGPKGVLAVNTDVLSGARPRRGSSRCWRSRRRTTR